MASRRESVLDLQNVGQASPDLVSGGVELEGLQAQIEGLLRPPQRDPAACAGLPVLPMIRRKRSRSVEVADRSLAGAPSKRPLARTPQPLGVMPAGSCGELLEPMWRRAPVDAKRAPRPATAARELADMNHNLAHIVAIELLIATQGVEFRAPVETSSQLQQVMKKVRSHVAPLEGDRYLADDIAEIKQLVFNRSIIAALGDTGVLPKLSP